MVKTRRGIARFIGRAEDDYRVFDAIEYEDFHTEDGIYSVAENSAFTAYTDDGELICAYVEGEAE